MTCYCVEYQKCDNDRFFNDLSDNLLISGSTVLGLPSPPIGLYRKYTIYGKFVVFTDVFITYIQNFSAAAETAILKTNAN
jgi:hypothetical protein